MFTSTPRRGGGPVERVPLHQVLPPGRTRVDAAVAHLGRHGDREEIVDWLRGHPAPVTDLAQALAHARAAWRFGADDLAEQALARLADRYPDDPGQRLLASVHSAFLGRHDEARRHARDAELLDPSDPRAAARTIRSGYRVDSGPIAEVEALDRLRRLPGAPAVLRAVADNCVTVEGFRRFAAVLDEHTTGAPDTEAVAALVAAALRVDAPESAVGILRRAIAAGPPPGTPDGSRWADRPAELRHALADVAGLLDSARVRHFATRQTLYGLVEYGDPVALTDRIRIATVDVPADTLVAHVEDSPRFLVTARSGPDLLDLVHRTGVRLRLLLHHQVDGELVHRVPGAHWCHTPVGIRPPTPGGQGLSLPADPRAHLAEIYGRSRPDRFDHDFLTGGGTAGRLTDPAHLRAHHFAVAWHHLRHHDFTAAAARLSPLGEAAAAARLVRRR